MSLHPLGQTRSRRGLDHLLQTPDTFVWAPLPGMDRASACVHVAPALGASFTQYSVVFEQGGRWTPPPASRFLYVLEGVLHLGRDTLTDLLQPGGYAYLPPGTPHRLEARTGPARVAVIEKPYRPLAGVPAPTCLLGQAADVPRLPLLGDDALQVQALLPAGEAFDMAVNLMEYQPGASLSMVEVHVMEHGLLMLDGGGIYRLGDAWYPVAKGDFIWMAPFCAQWFGALGKLPARYLIYKDWNRHPLEITP